MQKKHRPMWVLAFIISTQIMPSTSPQVSASGLAWPDNMVADSAFYKVWSRTDQPVAGGAATRSWLWGPVPFAVANESYQESATGRRLVEYLDKGRMEINDPHADRASQWFVTSGLLVNEMVRGQVQTGNSRIETHPPAQVPVAGDNTPQAPTYATFSNLTAPTGDARGKPANMHITKDGTVAPLANASTLDPKLFNIATFDDLSKHNVPAVFRDWTLQRGTVLENGRTLDGTLLDPLYVLGRPITEAYWVDVLVAGKPSTVLVQLFERRALTYNPANPPAWRVEMANVGRAYYSWRYGDGVLAPAVAAEVLRDGVQVRGWNWPPTSTVHLEIDLAGAVAPLAGPTDAIADSSGRITLLVPANTQLVGALIYDANVQIRANSDKASTALPLSGKALGGQVRVEGTITQEGGALLMQSRDGTPWTLSLLPDSRILYSEGDAAKLSAIRVGVAVRASGIAAGSVLQVSELRLASVSKTGAQLGATVQSDGRGLGVSGTGWPPERSVSFSIGGLDTANPQPVGKATCDSRGNLITRVTVPASTTLPAGPLWLFASVSDKGVLLAQVAVPLDAAKLSRQVLPPGLSAVSSAGEQAGGLGSYCWQRVCTGASGTALPGDVLPVRPGEVVGFRSQYGPNPTAGLTPSLFSAQVFSYDNPPDQVAATNDMLIFAPKGPPVHATGDIPGRPFSVTLPQVLPPGKYVMLVQVTWPDPAGGSGNALYAFTLLSRQ